MNKIRFSLGATDYVVRVTLPLLLTIEDELGPLPVLKESFEAGLENSDDVVSIIHMMIADTGEVIDYLKLKEKIQAEGYKKFSAFIRSFFILACIPSSVSGQTKKIRF